MGGLIKGLGSLLAVVLAAGAAWAGDSRDAVEQAISKQVVRGGIVFKTYCTLCHGPRGDGTARAAKLYGKRNLQIQPRDAAYYEQIIRKGGAAVGRSEFMPPWEGELSEEQISDVVAYLTVLGDQIRRGEVLYKTNCILCHGVNADGKGRAARLYDPPPANLRASDKNADYKRMIIKLGGAAMGRSPVMPQWGLELTDAEIDDIVAYLESIKGTDPGS